MAIRVRKKAPRCRPGRLWIGVGARDAQVRKCGVEAVGQNVDGNVKVVGVIMTSGRKVCVYGTGDKSPPSMGRQVWGDSVRGGRSEKKSGRGKKI